MKLLRILLIVFFFISRACSYLYSQDIMKRKKSGESRYLLRDSTGSYLIKEVALPDGSKSYSLIPKSYLEDTIGVEKNLPQSLQDWFYKNKKKDYDGAIPLTEEKDAFNFPTGRLSKDDTSAVGEKKNKAAWWIVGSTTVLGGVVAYIFLKYRKGVDELPIQPDPPR